MKLILSHGEHAIPNNFSSVGHDLDKSNTLQPRKWECGTLQIKRDRSYAKTKEVNHKDCYRALEEG